MNVPRGSIQDVTLYSKELDEEIGLLVYLPASYTPLKKYYLVIAQDGRDYFQLGRIGKITDELLWNGEIDNVIIIGIPYQNITDRRNKYHPNGAQQKAYIRFLAHELIPFLDREYPTLQVGSTRALIGDSLGATVSFMTALEYPNTFGNVLMQSPFVNEDVINAAKQADAAGLTIYHVIGTEETKVKTTDGFIKDFLTPNRKLSVLLKERNFFYFYEEYNGDHTWKYWQPDLKRALKYIF